MNHPPEIAPLVAAARRADQPHLLGAACDTDAACAWPTINALLLERLASHGDAEYLTFVDNEASPPAVARATYAETIGRVARLVELLDRLGLRPGDTISTVDRFNHADTVCLLLAAWCAGLRVAPLNVEEDDARLAFILENARTRVAFVRAAHLAQIERVNEAAGVPTLVVMGAARGGGAASGAAGGATTHPHLERLEAAVVADLADGALSALAHLERPVDPGAEALLVYTSGTTGHPKGVVLAHHLLFDVDAVVAFHGFGERDVFATAMRLFHVNAIITSMMSALVAGGRLVLLRRWDPRGFWGVVAAEGVTTTSVVPAMLADLLRAGGAPPAGVFDHFRTLICGAGTLKKSLARAWLDAMPVRIAHGWGMSETTCWGCWLPRDLDDAAYRALMLDHEAPSIGTPHHVNRMAILDGAGRPLPAGRKGQIVVAGPNVMEGYFERDDANADTFKFGVLETGDEGFWLPEPGGGGAAGAARPMFFITGRLKDIIERGGEKFSPYEMDDDFTAMPEVASALVFGFVHVRLGQEIGLVVEAAHDATTGAPREVTLDAVQRHAAARGYSWAKTPKELRVVPSIPKTATGKETRKLFADLFAGCEETHYARPAWWTGG